MLALTLTFFGGYAGYFLDPDRHLWEIARARLFAMRTNALLSDDRQRQLIVREAQCLPEKCAKRQYDRLTHKGSVWLSTRR